MLWVGMPRASLCPVDIGRLRGVGICCHANTKTSKGMVDTQDTSTSDKVVMRVFPSMGPRRRKFS